MVSSPSARAVRFGLWARAVWARWAARSRSRAELFALEDWQLRDIGLTRQQVSDETRKFFWMR